MRVGSTTTYLRLDGQGNVYQTRTTGGSVQAEYRYRAWGDRYNAATETVPSPFTYKAREEDRTTGLVYMRHRYYSPRLERFVNEDPIGTTGGLNVEFTRFRETFTIRPRRAGCSRTLQRLRRRRRAGRSRPDSRDGLE